MSNIGRFAIFALITNIDEETIRVEQRCLTSLTANTMALSFPVHITLKGRFIASEDIVINFLKEIDLTSLHLQTNIGLSKPRYIESQLSWLEVLPNTLGFDTLVLLHNFFEKEINSFVVLDEVPEYHKNLHFRPHITLGWGVTLEVWYKYSFNRIFRSSQAQISHVALARYHQKWPLEESVTSVLKIPIRSDTNQ